MTKMPRASLPEDRVYVIPELEIRVPQSWINLVTFCQSRFRNGELKIKIVNSQPTKLLEQREDIRFDKGDGLEEFPG